VSSVQCPSKFKCSLTERTGNQTSNVWTLRSADIIALWLFHWRQLLRILYGSGSVSQIKLIYHCTRKCTSHYHL